MRTLQNMVNCLPVGVVVKPRRVILSSLMEALEAVNTFAVLQKFSKLFAFLTLHEGYIEMVYSFKLVF